MTRRTAGLVAPKSAPLNHVEFPMFEALLADWNLVFLSFILLANFHGMWDTVDLHRAQIVSVPGESISEERICLFFGIFRIFEHLLLFSFISLTLLETQQVCMRLSTSTGIGWNLCCRSGFTDSSQVLKRSLIAVRSPMHDQHARRVSTSVSIFSIASWATGPGTSPCMISHSQSSCNVGFIRFNCQFKRKISGYTRVAQHFPVHFLWILYPSTTCRKQVMLQFLAANPWRHFNSESGLAFVSLLYLLSISIFFISITFVFSFLCRIQGQSLYQL